MKQWKSYLCCFLAALVFAVSAPTAKTGVQELAVESLAAAKPKLNKTKLTLKVGKSYTLKLKNAKNVTWKSKNKKIAKISSKGKVTGVKAGTTKVYAIYKNKKYSCKVTVKKESAVITDAEKKELAKTVSGREKLAKAEAEAIIKAEGIAALESDVAKVKAVHDYLVLNAAYDYENYLNNTIPETSYEAYGVIILKTGVCDSYTKAFQMFMDILGIPCERVTGTGNGGAHAWNVVTLDRERYHIDVTWDDPVPNTPGYVRYDYFLLDDKTMKIDHSWSSLGKSCTGTKYRTYPYEAAGQKADTLEEVKAIIKSQCAERTDGKYTIQILALEDIVTLDDIVGYVLEFSPNRYRYSYSYYPPVQVGEYDFYHLSVEVDTQ